jgi:hypothetical protein
MPASENPSSWSRAMSRRRRRCESLYQPVRPWSRGGARRPLAWYSRTVVLATPAARARSSSRISSIICRSLNLRVANM